jgi:hypothetical protein
MLGYDHKLLSSLLYNLVDPPAPFPLLLSSNLFSDILSVLRCGDGFVQVTFRSVLLCCGVGCLALVQPRDLKDHSWLSVYSTYLHVIIQLRTHHVLVTSDVLNIDHEGNYYELLFIFLSLL